MNFFKNKKDKKTNIYSKRIPIREMERFFEEENSLKGRNFSFVLKETKK